MNKCSLTHQENMFKMCLAFIVPLVTLAHPYIYGRLNNYDANSLFVCDSLFSLVTVNLELEDEFTVFFSGRK